MTRGRGFGRGRSPNSSRLGPGRSAADAGWSATTNSSSLSDSDRSRFFDVRFAPRPRPLPRPEPLPPRAAVGALLSPSAALVFPFTFPLPFGSSLFFLFFVGRDTSVLGWGSPSSSISAESGVAELRCLACFLRKSETTCWSRLLVYACRLRGAAFAPSGRSKNPARLPCAFAETF